LLFKVIQTKVLSVQPGVEEPFPGVIRWSRQGTAARAVIFVAILTFTAALVTMVSMVTSCSQAQQRE